MAAPFLLLFTENRAKLKVYVTISSCKIQDAVEFALLLQSRNPRILQIKIAVWSPPFRAGFLMGPGVLATLAVFSMCPALPRRRLRWLFTRI
jgi:hypothetical protein